MKASNGFKVCSHCRRDLSISDYHKNKTTHDGLGNQCKNCLLEIRVRNREKKHIYDKRYSINHSEHKKQMANDWYYKNQEYAMEKHRDYYKIHRDECLLSSKQWRKNNPERAREIGGRQIAKRKSMGFVKLWKNPFPSEVKIDWHHINGMLVVPMPTGIHSKCSNNNPEVHRERCNGWLSLLYGIDISKLLIE